jgi:phosphoenolpyruvate carboxykinase (ATP)
MATTMHVSDIAELLSEGRTHFNLSPANLVEHSLRRDEAKLADNGSIVGYTNRTGRSPKDKFIVKDETTASAVAWGSVNVPFESDKFDALYDRVVEHLRGRELYVQDLFCGADPAYRLPVRIVNEYAWHNLFVRQLFLRPTANELRSHHPEFTVISAPEFKADPKRDGVNSEVFILLNFSRRTVLIGGTSYAGEMKKSIFSVMNFLLPSRNVFPMHCSANVGHNGVSALFFGLSGTGKTTLSADPSRDLIGDDEHGWSADGIFNFEGGCYAKCIKLSKQNEPQIWNALRFGCVLENVTLDPYTRIPDYNDDSKTENTRAAADFPADSGAGHVSLSFGIHGQDRRHGSRCEGTAGDLLDLLRIAFLTPTAEGLRRNARPPPARAQRSMLVGQYGLAGRTVWSWQAHEHSAHAGDG